MIAANVRLPILRCQSVGSTIGLSAIEVPTRAHKWFLNE